MCRMTETGARWRREIDLPAYGHSHRWAVFDRDGEERYMLMPNPTYGDGDFLVWWPETKYIIRTRGTCRIEER